MVDWSLARSIARFAARSDEVAGLPVALPELIAEIKDAVRDYAAFDHVAEVPAPEAVSRVAWAEANLDTLSGVLEPVAQRLDDRLGAAGPFAGALRIGAGVTLAAEVGLVTGYMSQRVLGQYDLSLLGAESPARLLFVASNIERAAGELGVDEEAFLRWIAIHELTHALQFGGVPWLRSHLGGLLEEYLSSVDVRIDRGAAGGLPSMPSPAVLVERFREGGLAALVQNPAQQELLDRVQATMALVEGHAEHVMDALAPALVPGHGELRTAMDERRRNRSAPERVLMKLLGMDLKMRQYELGKSFCDAVVAEGGIALLNAAWRSPEAAPSLAELTHPGDWVARTAQQALVPSPSP